MGLEQAFSCPKTLKKLRSGPLGTLLDGFCTWLLEHGDINMVSYWLGHADINTTHVYVEIDMDMKRRMLQKTASPHTKNDLPWQKPEVLQWLATLGKSPKLCAVKP